MTSLTLRYSEDPVTGLPRLQDPSGSLAAVDLEALSGEIRRQFERLSSGPDRQVVALDVLARPDLPRHFRVTVIERGKRCPTLLLEAESPRREVPAPAAVADAPAPRSTHADRWQVQFLGEVAELLTKASNDHRAPLDFVLADLRALLRKNPHTFTLLLFAGYLHIGNALSVRNGDSEDNRYARAAEALIPLAGDPLPEGALDPLLPLPDTSACIPADTPHEQPKGWLRRFFSFS